MTIDTNNDTIIFSAYDLQRIVVEELKGRGYLVQSLEPVFDEECSVLYHPRHYRPWQQTNLSKNTPSNVIQVNEFYFEMLTPEAIAYQNYEDDFEDEEI